MGTAEEYQTRGTSPAGVPALELAGASKRIGRLSILNDVTFKVEQGSIAGLIGLNGAGKTTSLRVLLGLFAPTKGDALILGRPYVASRDPRAVGALVGRPALHPHLTAVETLQLFGASKGIAAHDLPTASRSILSEFEVIDYADRPIGRLSTGMTQRVAIALAFLGRPDVILLDEPTDGLDPDGIAILRGAIRDRVALGATVLFSSHLLTEVESLAHQVIIIHKGQILADAPQESFRETTALRVRFESRAELEHAVQVLTRGSWVSVASVEAPESLDVAEADGTEVMRNLARADIFPLEVVKVRQTLEETLLRLASATRRERKN